MYTKSKGVPRIGVLSRFISARCPSSGFDGVNKEANVRANAAVVPGYADVRASAVMTDDNNDGVDDSNFDDTLSEILGT